MPKRLTKYQARLRARAKRTGKAVPAITHELQIKRNRKGQWVVDEPAAMVWRGLDKVTWTLVPDPRGHKVSAHFQFPDMKLFVDLKGKDRLSKDKTAHILKPTESLTLKVHRGACRRTNPHHYAVWIRDETHRHGGTYAVGKDLNPPPEMTVGP